MVIAERLEIQGQWDRDIGTCVWGLETWRPEGRDVETSSMGLGGVWGRDVGMLMFIAY